MGIEFNLISVDFPNLNDLPRILTANPRYKILRISDYAFNDSNFTQLIKTIDNVRQIKEFHFKISNFSETQLEKLITLSSSRKGLKLVDIDGNPIGRLYANWESYVKAKEQLKEYPLREITSLALKYYQCAYGGSPQCVLDFGCGTGTDTIPLAHLEIKEIWAVDADEGAMNALERRLPASLKSKVKCINSSFLDLQIVNAIDMLVVNFTWPYRPPAQFPLCWQKCVTIVKPGGFILGHFFGPPDHCDNNMTYHTKKEVEGLLSQDFEIVYIKTEPKGTGFKVFGGSGQPAWGDLHHIIARKKITFCYKLKMRLSKLLSIVLNCFRSLFCCYRTRGLSHQRA